MVILLVDHFMKLINDISSGLVQLVQLVLAAMNEIVKYEISLQTQQIMNLIETDGRLEAVKISMQSS